MLLQCYALTMLCSYNVMLLQCNSVQANCIDLLLEKQ